METKKALAGIFMIWCCMGLACASRPDLSKYKTAEDVPVLIKYLSHKNYWTRISAAQKLGEIKDKRAVDPLVQKLLNDRAQMVRFYAANSLGKIGDKRAYEPLMKIFISGRISCFVFPKAPKPLRPAGGSPCTKRGRDASTKRRNCARWI